MDGFEDREPDRPGFVTSDENGDTYRARCVVTGKRIAYFPSNTKAQRQGASRTSVALALLCVTALVGGVFVLRSQYLYPTYGADTASEIAGALNSAQVRDTPTPAPGPCTGTGPGHSRSRSPSPSPYRYLPYDPSLHARPSMRDPLPRSLSAISSLSNWWIN